MLAAGPPDALPTAKTDEANDYANMKQDVIGRGGKNKFKHNSDFGLGVKKKRKGDKHARTIFVPKQMQRQLKTYLKTARKHSLHGFLFSTQKSQQFSANTATQHLQRLYARAAIQGATSHSGRRTWLTTLCQKGVSVRVLAEMAGHKSIQTTQRYIDVNDDMMRNAAELI